MALPGKSPVMEYASDYAKWLMKNSAAYSNDAIRSISKGGFTSPTEVYFDKGSGNYYFMNSGKYNGGDLASNFYRYDTENASWFRWDARQNKLVNANTSDMDWLADDWVQRLSDWQEPEVPTPTPTPTPYKPEGYDDGWTPQFIRTTPEGALVYQYGDNRYGHNLFEYDPGSKTWSVINSAKKEPGSIGAAWYSKQIETPSWAKDLFKDPDKPDPYTPPTPRCGVATLGKRPIGQYDRA